MLPDHVGIILLSATVPNTKEFADWVGCVRLSLTLPHRKLLSDPSPSLAAAPRRRTSSSSRRRSGPSRLSTSCTPARSCTRSSTPRAPFSATATRTPTRPTGASRTRSARRRACLRRARRAAVDEAARRAAGEEERPPRGAATAAAGRPRGRSPREAPWRRSGEPARARSTARTPRGATPICGSTSSASCARRSSCPSSSSRSARSAVRSTPAACPTRTCARRPRRARSTSSSSAASLASRVRPSLSLYRSNVSSSSLLTVCPLPAGSDKDLPQIKTMRTLLSRGIGVHHGGLLPIVKEVRRLALLLYAKACAAYARPRRADGRAPLRARARQGPLRDRDLCHGASLSSLSLCILSCSADALATGRVSTCRPSASCSRASASTTGAASASSCRASSASPPLSPSRSIDLVHD